MKEDNYDTDLLLYKELLDLYLKGNDSQKLKDFFDNILRVGHQVVNGEITTSSIDNQLYPIIIKLVEFNRDSTRKFLTSIDPENIKKDDYSS